MRAHDCIAYAPFSCSCSCRLWGKNGGLVAGGQAWVLTPTALKAGWPPQERRRRQILGSLQVQVGEATCKPPERESGRGTGQIQYCSVHPQPRLLSI